jgi:hypothetical protein
MAAFKMQRFNIKMSSPELDDKIMRKQVAGSRAHAGILQHESEQNLQGKVHDREI